MNYEQRLKILELMGTMNPTDVQLKQIYLKEKRNLSPLAVRLTKRACVYCGSKENLTRDHYIPKSKGGLDIGSNRVPACLKCNQEKGSLLPLDFILKRLGFI